MPDHLLQRNREWAARAAETDPEFFESLTEGQSPRFLWVSCSDSRVPANVIVKCHPGDLFVHRNIANRVDHEDLNGLSVLQYAVEALNVPHIIICGHYQCGGIKAAMEHTDHGLLDNWLRPVKHLYHRHSDELDAIDDEKARWDRLCELNVIDQVQGVASTTVVQQAWHRGRDLAIHGWIYQLSDGLIRNLDVTIDSADQIPPIYRTDASTNASTHG